MVQTADACTAALKCFDVQKPYVPTSNAYNELLALHLRPSRSHSHVLIPAVVMANALELATQR